MEAHPGGNPAPGPLDLVTGRAEVDARIREALFRSTELNVGGEKGARFEFSDGTLEVTKTVQAIKGGRAFRIEARVRGEGRHRFPTQLYWGPGFGQPSEDERSLRGYLPPEVVEIEEGGAEIRVPPAGLAAPRSIRAKLVGVENKYFAAVMTKRRRRPHRGLGQRPRRWKRIARPAPRDAAGRPDRGSQGRRPPPVAGNGRREDRAGRKLARPHRGAADARIESGERAGGQLRRRHHPSHHRHRDRALSAPPLRHSLLGEDGQVGPQIRAVQERYKRLSLTDPKRQQMQQEIAEVYEKNGIDMVRQTAAGCLPTLVMMPFLFAFYRMLDISVDLKGAPFFWIPDLSLKDPLFITPLLSGLSMIAMQRLMPAPAVDPAQQRMMMLMPIIFSGMFAWAPAGLNLYWFASNLVAMAQQALAMYFAPHLFPRAKPNP